MYGNQVDLAHVRIVDRAAPALLGGDPSLRRRWPISERTRADRGSPPRHVGVGDPAQRTGPSYLVWGLAGDAGMLLVVPHLLRGDVPDPVAEEEPVKGRSTEGSDDEDRAQRPYHCGH